MGIIKKSTELAISSTVKMMIYGQAGMGKTTFALSAPKPLLLDFDGGVKRVNLAHLEGVDIVQVNAWTEIQQLLQNDIAELAPYGTIVVDTVGKMMDFIISYVCNNRQPQLKDWGKVNQEFAWLTRTLSALNKHIVFVAHRDTRKEGDETVFIPALREKSYNAIVTELDLLGYLEMRSDNGRQVRTITFDPTSRNDGKNTCNLPGVMHIPALLDAQGKATVKNTFVSDSVITPYLSMLQSKIEERRRYEEVVERIAEGVELITDAASANEFADKMKEFKHVGSSKAKAAALFSAKVKALGLVYDKSTKTYSDAVA